MMIISLDKLVEHLQGFGMPNDAKPSDALWIRFGEEKTRRTVEYKTSTGNEIVHIYLDENDALVGIEIFP